MYISTASRSMIETAQQRGASPVFPVKPAGERPADIASAFHTSERRFGESFDCSSHAAVIKLMMMTFGQRPAAMFNELLPSGDGYDVTMKDEFKLHLSRQELQQASQASRFTGADAGVVKDANFMFAAFVKRKQLTGGYATFEAALAKTLEGETTQRCLQGMGVFGLSQFVPVSDMAGKGAVGVLETHNRGSALVREGVRHDGGTPRTADRGYGYVLFDDQLPPPSNRGAAPVVASVRPADIWSGFYQGVEGNCVTVSAIKAAMIRFGQDPRAIYKQVQITPTGFDVVMRDAFRLQLTHEEVRQAAAESNFHGNNRQLLNAAHFLYAVSAKRAQIENNDFRARQSYTTALQTLNDGEYPGEALRRLGLFGYVRESTVAELANGAIGTLADNWHSVAVIDGALDFYGKKHDLASSRWMSSGFRALKLV
ncbi:Arc/MetJ family transcription regulator [Pseudomonas sp. TE36184]